MEELPREPDRQTPCHHCEGYGQKIDTDGHTSTLTICPRCRGSGRELADLMGIDRVNGTRD